jgi:hypothetical protein
LQFCFDAEIILQTMNGRLRRKKRRFIKKEEQGTPWVGKFDWICNDLPSAYYFLALYYFRRKRPILFIYTNPSFFRRRRPPFFNQPIFSRRRQLQALIYSAAGAAFPAAETPNCCRFLQLNNNTLVICTWTHRIFFTKDC